MQKILETCLPKLMVLKLLRMPQIVYLKITKHVLDNLPPIPSLENYVQKDSDATLNTLEVQDKLSFKTGNGGEINFSDILKFNNGGFTKMAIVNSTIDVHVPISMDSNRIINLASGEDGDNNAAKYSGMLSGLL